MKKTINVTEKHIKDGVPFKRDSCMLALAAQEVLGSDVCMGVFALYKEYKYTVIELPEDVVNKRRDFDNRKPVEPFSFEVEVPEDF